jgi:hypothetical protein
VQTLNKYELRTLINEEVNSVDEGVAGFVTQGIKSGLKSIGLSIPGIDFILGSAVLLYELNEIRMATDKIVAMSPVKGESIIEKLASQENEWQESLAGIRNGDPAMKNQIKDAFNDVLESLKDSIVTIVQSYDSLVAAPVAAGAGAATMGGGAVAVEGGTNIATGIIGFVTSMIPAEQVIFEFATEIAGFLSKLFGMLSSEGGEAKGKLEEFEEKGGFLIGELITNPARTLGRLGELYNALHKEGQRNRDVLSQGVKSAALDMSNFSANDNDRQMVAESRNRRLTDQSPVLTESRMLKLAGIK